MATLDSSTWAFWDRARHFVEPWNNVCEIWSSSGSSSSTTSSEDVFRVGVENFSSRTNIDEEESKTSSTASSIADWLKQVRVITDVNILNNATEQDALEGVSLEHSMASSSIGVSLPETAVKKVTEV